MTNDSIVANLFGIDPALLGQQQQQQDNVFGMQMAQLAPEQAAAAPVYSMTQNLGRQVGSLLGIEDPVIAKNSKIKAIQQQVKSMGMTSSSPEGMMKYSELLSEAGLDDVAAQARDRAMQMAEQAAKTGKAQADLLKEAQFRKALATLDPADPEYQTKLMQVASQFGSPDKVMDIHTKSLDKQERIEFKREELKQKHEDRMEELRLRGADQKEMQRERLAFEARMQSLNADLRRELAANKGSNPAAPTLSTIIDPNDPNQQIVVDARRWNPQTREGLVGVSGRLSDAAKADQKNKVKMGGAGELIDEAETILNGPVKPTNSLAGSLYDKAASVVGASPEGAAEADKLKVIGGALVSKMPRMEGPQSDKDTALYREMAGRVGDDTLPVARRKAALETVKQLYVKYAPGSAPAKSTVSVDALLEKYK